jgi:murein DD-endopeptidase MepM/ murein hydrolase activator NlpD
MALMLAGCGTRPDGPAPLVNGTEAAAPPPPAQVTVARGQTLSGIAATYNVPTRALADANRLSPPYRIIVGQTLVIPGGGAPAPYAPSLAMAAPPPSSTLPPQAVPSAPPPVSQPLAAQPIPLDRPPPPRPPTAGPTSAPPPAVVAAPPPAEPLPPPSPPTAAREAAAPPDRTAAATPPPAAHGGNFLWPVRGRVIEGYGAGPDGTHNDGINIAAPRGAAVEATDGGIVAYTGNELRGYGNLILIKHPNGFISAYAHCDLVLVKTGQKVARGQVIARVGATGNVGEPQLHFELRRGKKPVDPSDYLAPLPTAAAKEPHPG